MKDSYNGLAYLKYGIYGRLDLFVFMSIFLTLHHTTLALVSFIAGKNSLLRREPLKTFVVSCYRIFRPLNISIKILYNNVLNNLSIENFCG